MVRQLKFSVLFCAMILQTTAYGAAHPWAVQEHVVVNKQQITLVDLLNLPIASNQINTPFAQVIISNAPKSGERLVLTRAQVLNAMHRHLGFAYDQKIALPKQMVIERVQGINQDQELIASAQNLLQKTWAQTCSDELSVDYQTKQTLPLLPNTPLSFKARLLPTQKINKKTPVWVDVFEEAQLHRSIPIWFDVVCRKRVATTAANFPVGTVLSEQNIVWQSVDIAALPTAMTLPNEQQLMHSQLRRTLGQNTPILATDIQAIALVKRNTQAQLHITQQSMNISLPVTVPVDARLNDIIFVKSTLGSGQTTLKARVIGANRLALEE